MKSDRRLARSVSFPRVINIGDFRRLAKRRLPAVVFAYIDGGAEDEVTLRENSRAFSDISDESIWTAPRMICPSWTTGTTV